MSPQLRKTNPISRDNQDRGGKHNDTLPNTTKTKMSDTPTNSNRPSTEEGVKEARRVAREKALNARTEMLRVMRELGEEKNPAEMTREEVEREYRLLEEYARLKAVKAEADREEWELMTEEEKGRYEEGEEEEDE